MQAAVSRVMHVPVGTTGLLSSTQLVGESPPPPPPSQLVQGDNKGAGTVPGDGQVEAPLQTEERREKQTQKERHKESETLQQTKMSHSMQNKPTENKITTTQSKALLQDSDTQGLRCHDGHRYGHCAGSWDKQPKLPEILKALRDAGIPYPAWEENIKPKKTPKKQQLKTSSNGDSETVQGGGQWSKQLGRSCSGDLVGVEDGDSKLGRVRRHRGRGTSLRGKEQPSHAQTRPATAFPALFLHWDGSKPLCNEWDLSPSLKGKDQVIPGS